MNKRYLILGNGIAALSAARQIRRLVPKARIIMLSDETEDTYSRPLLSKTWFRSFQAEKTLVIKQSCYEEHHIERILNVTIDHLDTGKQRVFLDNGNFLEYDACIYALGASCFVPPFRGKDQDGVFTVRTFQDFNRIRRKLLVTEHAVVIGGGVIGLEMAWELSRMDCQVTILEAGPRLMGRLLDQESADVLTEFIEKAGIPCYAGVQIAEIEGNGTASGVRLADGRRFPAELVIVSCGVRANTRVALQSGIDCDRGVLVDDYMRTNCPNVYAAGDCIQWKSPNPGLWNYARTSGETAGTNAVLMDDIRSEKAMPFSPGAEAVLITGMGTSIFAIGDVTENADVRIKRVREENHADSFFQVNPHKSGPLAYTKKFYREDRLVGAVLMGDLREMELCKARINGGTQ
ncbi:MAG: FAD-dependent oxidoreductase [Clostridiales bacterium]|nr:FAD-dependent oxidoreductase [Clostridiales bacterium]